MAEASTNDADGWDDWIPGRSSDLVDPTPSRILNDFDRKDWTGNLAPAQVDVLVYVYGLVRQYTSGPDDARKRMPFAMSFLEHAIPLSASLFGKGRSELVEMLKQRKSSRESVEAMIAPIESRGEGSDRGL